MKDKFIAAALAAGILLGARSTFADPPPRPAAAGCPELSADVVSYLKGLATDPHVLHENRRRARRDMIEESLYDVCLHETWLALHGKAPDGSVATGGIADPDGPIVTESAAVGADIAPPTVLPPVGSDGLPAYQGETAISIDPADPLRMVGHANTFYLDPAAACQAPAPNASKTDGTMALYGSDDGGVTWHYNCAPWPSDGTGSISGASAFFGSDPAVDWDSSGNAWAAYLLIDENGGGTADGSGIAVAKSTDSGLSWSPVGMVVNNLSNSSLFEDKELMAIDRSGGAHDGRIYVVWDENNAERIAFSDSGATGSWTTVVLDSTHVCIGADVKVGDDGTVYAVWNRLGFHGNTQSSESTVFAKSTNGGATWSSAVTVATHRLFSFGSNPFPSAQNKRGVNAFPSLDIDRNPASAFHGRLYVTYGDFPLGTTSGNDLNVYLKRSTDGGATWTADPGVLVNDDGGASTQFFPWLAVDPTDGTVNLAWYDTRNDANNKRTQVFYARSSNGGTSVEPNVVLMDGGANFANAVSYCDENSTDNSSYNANQYGDYSGIAANFRQVHALWTDSRNLYPSMTDTRREDVATTTVVNCSPPVWSEDPSVACGPSGNTVTWSLPAWGTNATAGTFTVDRFTDAGCTMGKTAVASGLSAATTEYLDATASANAVYYYTVTAKNDCPGTALTPMSAATACVTFPSDLTPAITGPDTSCAGQQVTLDAGPGFDSYSWSPGGATTRTISPSPAATTTYTVTVTSAGTCPAQTSHLVTVKALPTAVASGTASICAGSSTALSGSGGTGCSWSPSTGLDDASSCSPHASPSSTTTYTLTVMGANGCSSTNAPTATVTVNPKPTAVASGTTTICAGSSATLSGSGGTSCSWSPSTGLDNAASCSPHASPSSTTTYTLTVMGANGCSSTNAPTVTVTVNPKPTAVASGSAAICPGTSATLSGSGGTSCSWSPSTGLDNASSCSPHASPSSTTTYTLTVASAAGCSSTNAPTATVTVLAAPTPTPASLPDGAVSVPYSQTIGSSTGTAPFAFAVVSGALPNGLSLDAATGKISGPPTVGNDFSFTIRVTDAHGCTADKAYAIHVTNLAAQSEEVEGRSPYPPAAEPNGVLESGESVSFAPAWKNAGATSAAAIAGTVSAFTGPNNGTVTYGMPKTGATYGTLASGATGSCGADCYTLSLASSSRPATHWDATVTETLSNGQTHGWNLHVGGSFNDVPTTNGFYSYIETIFHFGITTGTSPGVFSPGNNTQRSQMTALIARASTGSDASIPTSGTVPGRGPYNCVSGGTSIFSDVAPTLSFCKQIHWAAAHGLTYGCTDGTTFTTTFCPADAITRRSMAVMLARDIAGGDAGVPTKAPDSGNGRPYDCTDGLPNAFSDVPDSDVGCKHIYYLWSKNIVDGFGNGTFGPDGTVVRSQMAKFIVNTLKLTIDAP